MLSRTLIPYFMEFLNTRELVYFSSINHEYFFYLKTFIKIEKKHDAFCYSCITGNIELVNFIIETNDLTKNNEWLPIKDYRNRGMRWAAQFGHKELINLFIKLGADDWNCGMVCAAKGGHRDLINFFISLGANSWDYGMACAAEGGHKDLVDFFMSKGAIKWSLARKHCVKELKKFFKQKQIQAKKIRLKRYNQ